MKQLTGQIMTRPAGTAPDGREFVMIFGVVAVDPDSPLKKEGTQFIVVGPSDFDETTRRLSLNIMQDGQIDRSKLSVEHTPSGLLMEPIWRV